MLHKVHSSSTCCRTRRSFKVDKNRCDANPLKKIRGTKSPQNMGGWVDGTMDLQAPPSERPKLSFAIRLAIKRPSFPGKRIALGTWEGDPACWVTFRHVIPSCSRPRQRPGMQQHIMRLQSDSGRRSFLLSKNTFISVHHQNKATAWCWPQRWHHSILWCFESLEGGIDLWPQQVAIFTPSNLSLPEKRMLIERSLAVAKPTRGN